MGPMGAVIPALLLAVVAPIVIYLGWQSFPSARQKGVNVIGCKVFIPSVILGFASLACLVRLCKGNIILDNLLAYL